MRLPTSSNMAFVDVCYYFVEQCNLVVKKGCIDVECVQSFQGLKKGRPFFAGKCDGQDVGIVRCQSFDCAFQGSQIIKEKEANTF